VNGWRVELSKVARRDLRTLDDGPRQAALEIIEELHDGPALFRAFEMRGMPDTWKVRFHHDDYRMIYLVARGRRRIIVKRMRARPIAYEGMKR
jgi:mRNA-degrading endonuclease RelE of RelBE toxin-antitoxin system